MVSPVGFRHERIHCENCAKGFLTTDQTPVRVGRRGEVWVFCSERCREEFKDRERLSRP